MHTQPEAFAKSLGNGPDRGFILARARLKKLRRERFWLKKAIMALTELSLARRLGDRRASRFRMARPGIGSSESRAGASGAPGPNPVC
jgi:hypothetical protein